MRRFDNEEKSLDDYAADELVECAKDLIDELDWLVRAYEKDEYRIWRAKNVADAIADVKHAQKIFNRAMRAYQKVAE